jgi:hypothetical protein
VPDVHALSSFAPWREISRKGAKLAKTGTEGMAIARRIFVSVSRAQISYGGFETIIQLRAAIS